HVAQGEVLFEVAPLNAYRLILQVDERRVADIRKGQQGELVLSSLPGKQFKFIVEKITPISTAREGRNYFRVEARILNVSQRLRPGMEGVGKVFVERRKLVRIWTQNLREWFSLWLWSWWP
ncbi:MAG: HlyD family secretion protein, partial [Deltaproteobacteria bacterium]|nr:HlyD family secretion protein [Deltaproteobacteria bacterium]